MEDIKLTYLDVLNDTIKFYNENDRAIIDSTGRCMYLTPDGKSCAVGRYINDIDSFVKTNNFIQNESARGLFKTYGFDILNDSVKHLTDAYFWSKLQYLHDTTSFWNDDKTLSFYGIKEVEEFISNINNNLFN